MKKAILAVLALASVVACNKSEVLEVAPQKAISFGNPFVGSATKAIDPSETTTYLTNFKVYGALTNEANSTVKIFDNTVVYKNIADVTNPIGQSWYYAGTAVQYWIPGNTYNFAAVVNGDVTAYAACLPEVISYNVAEQKDLLYAKSDKDIKPTAENFSSDIAFTFNHLLSKVVFNFENNYPAETNLKIKVEGINIINAATGDTYTISTDAWANTSSPVTLSFGNAVSDANATIAGAAAEFFATGNRNSNFERLLIPGTYNEIKITFDAKVYMADETTVVDEFVYTTEKPATIKGITLNAGYAYSFNVSIGDELTPITFSVSETAINDWTPGANQNITVQ